MAIQLTLCRLCTRNRPDFHCAVAKLLATFPEHVVIEELDCIAACDEVPAVMIEADFFPQVDPYQLITIVQRRISEQTGTGLHLNADCCAEH